jgi:hypothetical protein
MPQMEYNSSLATHFLGSRNSADFIYEGIVFGTPSDKLVVEPTDTIVRFPAKTVD